MSGLGISLVSGVILAKNDALLGIEDTSETLYEAKFSDPTNLGNDINNIYAKNLNNAITVYMRPKIASQIYDSNRWINSSEYNQTTADTSPILGGKNIQVSSNNVTVIGGENIKIQGNNENASILGINNGEVGIGDSHSTTPAILIGGESNTIGKNQEGNAIIGGKQNIIADTTQDTHILGGQNNENSTDSAIIAGANIQNAQAGKSFIFSNSVPSDRFIPSSSNSFYLNTKNGLGINKAIVSSGGGVESAGAINVGNINIDSTLCTTDNIGLFGYFNQCLVGCTTGSSNNGGKRNLMDAHTGCVDMCNTTYSGRCIAPDPVIIPATGSVCIGGRIDNSKRCNEDLKNNIISKTLDIKFNTEFVSVCPDSLDKVANPCLYTCVDGAHEIDGACKRDCNFDGITLKHGETVTGYKHSIETCSGQCNNNVKLLKCDDGTLRIQPSNDSNNGTYTVRSCTTTGNDLPCEGFNLTKDQIDQHLTGHNYLTCTGYTVDGPTCKPYNKYRLNTANPCQNGWTYQSDLGYCTKNCTRNGNSGYTRGQHVTGWNAAEVTCTSTSSTCTAKQLTCQEDGSWGADETTYPYTQCNLIGETCINHTLTSCPQNGYCSECFSYTTNSSYQCLSGTTHYRLDGCENGYTLINNKCEPECTLPRGEKIKYGETRKGYEKSEATCNKTCEANSVTYKCEANGVLQGGDIAVYTNKECVVHDVTCESNFNLTGKFSHGKFDTCTGYTTDGTSCTQFLAYDLTGCNDLYTYTGDSCIAKCRLPWDTGKDASTLVDHGTKTGAYLATIETCGEKCTSVYTGIICSGGNRYYQSNPTTKANTGAGGYKFKSCEQKVPNCTIYTKNNSGIYITFSGLSQPIISHATLAGSPCLDYTYQTGTDTCLHNFTNYTFKCDSSYAWNNGGSACTRCQQNDNNTNLPAHAVRNNTNQPNTITTWTYDSNTGSSTACSYHCDNRSKRDGTKCAGDCLLKNANGSEAWYKHDSHVTGYTQTTYQCTTDSTTCQSALLTCDNGQWKNNAGEIVTQYIYNTGHTTDKKITKTNSNPRRTLDHLEAHTTSQVNLGTEYFTDNNCGCTEGETRIKQQCASGYARGTDNKCHKQCTLERSDGTTKTLNNGESQSVATSASVLCPNSCTYETRTCNEGTLSGSGIYKSCSRIGVTNNDYTQKNSCPSHCKCDGPVTDYANSTCTASIWYKITGTESDQYYRTGGNTCPAVCTPNKSNPCAIGYGSGRNNYPDYTCIYSGSTANCTCEGDKVRNENGCTVPRDPCGDTVNTCVENATFSDLTDTTTQYKWQCTLGSIKKTCSKDKEIKPERYLSLLVEAYFGKDSSPYYGYCNYNSSSKYYTCSNDYTFGIGCSNNCPSEKMDVMNLYSTSHMDSNRYRLTYSFSDIKSYYCDRYGDTTICENEWEESDSNYFYKAIWMAMQKGEHKAPGSSSYTNHYFTQLLSRGFCNSSNCTPSSSTYLPAFKSDDPAWLTESPLIQRGLLYATPSDLNSVTAATSTDGLHPFCTTDQIFFDDTIYMTCWNSCDGPLPVERNEYTIVSQTAPDNRFTSWSMGDGIEACTWRCADDATYNSTLKKCEKRIEYPECGSAHGTQTLTKPTTNLCNKGTASAVTEYIEPHESDNVLSSNAARTRTCNLGYTEKDCAAYIPVALVHILPTTSPIEDSPYTYFIETFASPYTDNSTWFRNISGKLKATTQITCNSTRFTVTDTIHLNDDGSSSTKYQSSPCTPSEMKILNLDKTEFDGFRIMIGTGEIY